LSVRRNQAQPSSALTRNRNATNQQGNPAVILLDTNVISELMRPQPEPKVLAWADVLDAEAVAITAMTEAEILHGLARLPDGRRKQNLQQSWDALMADVFTGRVWPFTSDAAHWYAQLLRRREPLGRSMATSDAVIAATALAQGALLATRGSGSRGACWLPGRDAVLDDAPGLCMLRRGQGLNASWPGGQPLPDAAAMVASLRGA
jgi:hypothetical protein